MVLPIYAGLERVPDSLFEASGDLGAGGLRPSTRRPALAFPAIIAGSIFTFSLSLGDYIAVQIVGGASQLIGNVVYANVGSANNLPFASALAPSRSWSCSSTSPPSGGPAPWTTCDHLRTAARRAPPDHRRGAGDRLRATAAGAGQLLQRRPHLRLAAERADAALVEGRRAQLRRAARAAHVRRGGAARDGDRTGAGHARWPWRCVVRASSGATSSRCWSSCRSRCRAS